MSEDGSLDSASELTCRGTTTTGALKPAMIAEDLRSRERVRVRTRAAPPGLEVLFHSTHRLRGGLTNSARFAGWTSGPRSNSFSPNRVLTHTLKGPLFHGNANAGY